MKTKIVATIGPASSSRQTLEQLISAGVDVLRLNFSHGNYSEFERIITDIRELNRKMDTHVAILADLQGPKIRIGEIEGGGMIIRKGDQLILTTNRDHTGKNQIFINYGDFPKDVKPGEKILLDDGKFTLQIVETDGITEVKAEVVIGGKLMPRKGVNLPDTKISLPSLSEKDKMDIRFILEHDIEWVGLSFVRSAADIIELSSFISQLLPRHKPFIMAKIEKPEAVEAIDEILTVADGIMIARGDLGVEVPLQAVPLIQKQIVKKCMEYGKPVIIATQMMEGMITNSRPTRAEVNDVANSVMDGADALMLSGETSVGTFPVETVETMQKIISEVEDFEDIYHRQHQPVVDNNPRFISDSIIYSGVNMAHEAKARAIVSVASSGYSVIKISSHRPKADIFAFAPNDFLLRQLNLIWGVTPIFFDKILDTDQTISDMMTELKERGFAKQNDLVVHISNMPINQPGKSNMLKLSYME
ncbi:MAG: pyruvate kinase [Bacteroidales bacterium]|nr:pyruvate kinase [Bacteroidales bacterium]